ncbi:Nterminal asparagine amidase, partial [Caligus rogercresseyi]
STVDKHGLHYLGSDEATTCVILVASNETHVGLAHLDRCEPGGLRSFIDRIGGGKEFTLDIVGGFQDPKETTLIAFPEVFTLRTTCVGGFNTQMKKGIPWPRVYGVAVDIRKREVLPGSFNFHGPGKYFYLINYKIMIK